MIHHLISIASKTSNYWLCMVWIPQSIGFMKE
jgi:hypothetical protein